MQISPNVQIEIINTGSELLLGRILNTHQRFLCRHLADLGCVVSRLTCVTDAPEAIREAVRDALARADVVVTTGGLGPTSDDRTRSVIADLLGTRVVPNEQVLARIRDWFISRNRPMPASTSVQALVPDGALVLVNEHGTAPGLVLDIPAGRFRAAAGLLVMLPGPPRELHPMFTSRVLPLLRERFSSPDGFICRTLKTTGLGESRVEEIIAPRLASLLQQGLEIGYCARTGEVDVRFAARGERAAAVIANAEQITRELMGDFIFGSEDEQLEDVVVGWLARRRQTIALAESCTGGFIAHRITNVPGASAVLWGGFVSYANDAKTRLLGVSAAALAEHGAVSEPVAGQMAEGARAAAATDYAIAVTGVAGPAGGSAEKPVGTVFIALAGREGTRVERFLNSFDRETFKHVTSQQALEMLRRELRRDMAAGEKSNLPAEKENPQAEPAGDE